MHGFAPRILSPSMEGQTFMIDCHMNCLANSSPSHIEEHRLIATLKPDVETVNSLSIPLAALRRSMFFAAPYS